MVKVAILAGGLGTRLGEETAARPKPMVEIGGKPILWHIMKLYAHHGFKDFCIALGYLGDYIKSYFLDCHNLSGNLTIDFARGEVSREETEADDWVVSLIDTGAHTYTGGRLARLQSWLRDETFMLTYGDGVADVDLSKLLRFHQSHGKLATVTAVRPPARFGGLIIRDGIVDDFTEKPMAGEGWINGGFLVFEPGIFDYLDGDRCSLEADALERLAKNRELAAYQHFGFWQCMDTLRDKNYLQQEWETGAAPWKVWESSRDVQPVGNHQGLISVRQVA